MSLIHTDTLAEVLPIGSIIQGISVEYGDDYNFDFIVLNSAYDITIESNAGDSSLVKIEGDLNSIVELPVTAVYSTGFWVGPDYETHFVIRTDEGEVKFIWVGYVSGDVEARAC